MKYYNFKIDLYGTVITANIEINTFQVIPGCSLQEDSPSFTL